jgi:hypothetical protein
MLDNAVFRSQASAQLLQSPVPVALGLTYNIVDREVCAAVSEKWIPPTNKKNKTAIVKK